MQRAPNSVRTRKHTVWSKRKNREQRHDIPPPTQSPVRDSEEMAMGPWKTNTNNQQGQKAKEIIITNEEGIKEEGKRKKGRRRKDVLLQQTKTLAAETERQQPPTSSNKTANGDASTARSNQPTTRPQQPAMNKNA